MFQLQNTQMSYERMGGAKDEHDIVKRNNQTRNNSTKVTKEQKEILIPVEISRKIT